jgi:hypothetical protein
MGKLKDRFTKIFNGSKKNGKPPKGGPQENSAKQINAQAPPPVAR